MEKNNKINSTNSRHRIVYMHYMCNFYLVVKYFNLNKKYIKALLNQRVIDFLLAFYDHEQY